MSSYYSSGLMVLVWNSQVSSKKFKRNKWMKRKKRKRRGKK